MNLTFSIFFKNMFFKEGESKQQLTDLNQQYAQLREDHQV
jgi:hypothetical protein